jgi:hypothetical protein
MGDCFVADLLSILLVIFELYFLSHWTGLEYHTGIIKILFSELFCCGKCNGIDEYFDKRIGTYRSICWKAENKNLNNQCSTLKYMIDNKKKHLKKIREIYRYVIFKYVFIPRCILGLLLLVIEFILLVVVTDNTMSSEFEELIVAASVFFVYSLGVSIFVGTHIKIKKVTRSQEYKNLESELNIKISMEIWDVFDVERNEISVCVHYLILIGYKCLDIITNALFIRMAILFMNRRTLSKPLSMAALALNSAECFLDFIEFVALCINLSCECCSDTPQVHPEPSPKDDKTEDK